MKKSMMIYIAAGAIIIAGLAYFLLSSSFKYEVLDEIKEETEGGNMTFLFVSVSKLDSLEIRDAAKELFNKRIVEKFKDAKIPNNSDHEMIPPEVLIAYFYKQDDTTAIPDQMKMMLMRKFQNNHALRENLDYISEGYVYSGVYHSAKKKQTMDSLSPKTMLFVPKKGVKASDVMKNMPKNSEMDQLPQGHPPVEMEGMPQGHPPVEMEGMPQGHPPVNQKESVQ